MSTWIKFKLIERPYYDGRGDALKDIQGRKNRSGIDEFYGGGFIYPQLPFRLSKAILERYEKGNTMILSLDLAADEVKSLLEVKETWAEGTRFAKRRYASVPRETIRLNMGSFNPVFTDEKDPIVIETRELIKSVSGVTR